MSDRLSIPEFEMAREDLHRAFSKADTALAAGTITRAQRDAFLLHQYDSADERDALERLRARAPLREPPQTAHDPRTLIAGFAILMVVMFSTLFWLGGGITGAVVADTTFGFNQTYTASDTLRVILDNTDAVSLTGHAFGQGDVTVTLALNGSEWVLFTHRYAPPQTSHGSLERSQYTILEPVTLTATGVSAATLTGPDGTTEIDPTNYSASLPEGAYAITLSGDEAGVPFTETLPFVVVQDGSPEPTTQAIGCGEACALASLSGTATLRIEISGDAAFTLSDIILTRIDNSPPIQSVQIPDQEGETVTLDLGAYFIDPDGDDLLYDTSHPAGASETMTGSVVTISGRPGVYTYLAYASDLSDLVQSNAFTVTLLAANTTNETVLPTNETNITVDVANETNGTIPVIEPTLNETNVTIETNTTNVTGAPAIGLNETNLTIDECAVPDPNLRPESCLNQDGATYFEEDVFLETPDREARARVTAIGNLLITGRIIPYSTGTPGGRDYTIGYKNGDFQYVPTIWIDADGNLNLRGTVHEENANLVPPPGSHALINRRGVYMLWADTATGDLYIRGNVIPYRVSIYE